MKRIFLIILIVVAIFMASSISYVKFGLPDVGDAPEITIEITPERIERGDYIANKVALCMDCHATRDWSLLAGPPKPGTEGAGGERFDQNMGFPGVFYSRNITPYRLKDWSDGEIFRAITTGVSKDGSALFPVMPYSNYRNLDREDIYSVIAYLRSLEPIENTTAGSIPDFPMNIIINTIPQEANLQPIPDKSNRVEYGNYLLTMASCSDCHTPFVQGEPIEGMYMAGGHEFKMPWGIVRPANLTPDMETGIGTWTEEQFVSRFNLYEDSSYVVPRVDEGDFITAMPWMMYSGMEDDDLKAIFAYLQSIPPNSNQVTKWTPN